MMKIEIREMREADIGDVQHVATASWHTTYEGIIPQGIQDRFLDAAYSEQMMRIRRKQSLILVAEVGGEIVGYANYTPVNEAGMSELAAIYLLESAQGNGIGSAFLTAGIERLPGVKEIQVNVEKRNTIGMNFYEAKGFQTIDEFDDDFDGHILETLRMTLVVE